MSCAQVMYQPYAPNPYVVPQEVPPSATPSSSASQTLPSGPPSAESIHSHEAAVLQQHHASAALTAPATPQPQHMYQQHLQQQQSTPPTAHSSSSGDSGGGGGAPPVGSSSVDGGSGQRGALRPPHRSDSNGSSAHGDPDAPPPEKRFCTEADAPSTPRTPSLPHPASVEHQHQQQQSPSTSHHQQQHHHQQHHQQHHAQHHAQLLSHHDLPHHSQQHHHHPPHTEHPPPSPTEETNADVKYLTANCMVVTYCKGDVMSVVDEHFTRALYEKPEHSPGKASPMSSRNFPPSFWNSHYQPPVASTSSSRPPSLAGHLPGGAELYDPYHAGLHSLQHHGASDPWSAYSLSTQAYGHRAHDVYQAAMAGVPSSSRAYHNYSSLSFQPHLPRLPTVPHQMSMGKADTWGARYADAFTSPELAAAHGLQAADYSANHYANMTAAAGTNIKSEFSNHYANMTGLETAVPQEGAKDLYWF